MHKLPQPVKLWYTGPMFRYEAPQSGRFRQHSQIGAETIGSDDPAVDAELIDLLAHLYARLRAARRAAAPDEHRRPRVARRVRARAARLPARPRRVRRRAARPDRDQPDAGVRLGRRRRSCAVTDAAPKMIDRLSDADARALRRGAPAARRRGDRLRARPAAGARARLLHAHGVRVPLRRARRAERHRRRRALRPPDRAARRAADARAPAGRPGSSGSRRRSSRRRGERAEAGGRARRRPAVPLRRDRAAGARARLPGDVGAARGGHRRHDGPRRPLASRAR